MDSLTQVVLGSAVGEATLGHKVGNRAMLWGGIAGTIPDLDVLSGLVTDPISALAYHRAFTHSLLFPVLAAPILGLTVHRLYGGRDRLGWTIYPLALALFFAVLWGGSALMPIAIFEVPLIAGAITCVPALIMLVLGLRERLRGSPSTNGNASRRGWTALFFMAIITHPLLDGFTSYGTQLFEPFAATRIAWNTISVLDPFYTLPFLVFLLLAARKRARTRVRGRLNKAGLLVSTAYLLLTVVNHFNVRDVMHDTLGTAGVRKMRSVQSPGLGSNLLWSVTAQIDAETYYFGQYSLLDERRELNPFLPIKGRHDLLAPYAGDRELEIVKWFTQGYYTVVPADTSLFLCDLRYGVLGEDPDDPGAYLFKWRVDTTRRPVRLIQEQSAMREEGSAALARLWERLKGV